MRLDHLLSKERWPARSGCAGGGVGPEAVPGSGWSARSGGLPVSGVVLEGGTLTRFGRSSRGLVVGALLGPEGTGRSRWGWVVVLGGAGWVSYRPGCVPGGWRGRWAGVWLLVENCTVDASIFYCSVSSLSSRGWFVGQWTVAGSFRGAGGGFRVVKLLRAHGGCLGTRSR